MTNKMLIDATHPDEARMAIIRDGELYDYDFVTSFRTQLKGNIYLAKVTRVEPSLQAAFVEYGGGKQGFLPFSEIHADYYNMPVSDKEKLLEEQIAEAEAEEAEEEEAFEREQAARESRTRGRRGRKPANDDVAEDDATQDAIDDDTNDAITDADGVDADNAENNGDAADLAVSVEEPHPIAEDQEAPKNSDDALAEETDGASNIAQTQAAVSVKSDITSDALQSTDAALEESEAEAKSSSDDKDDKDDKKNDQRRNGRPTAFYRRYKIQEVIKRNQVILVQITKEERGNKGCSLTTYISLAGRYSVLMPNSPKGGGISRKITDRETRRRLKEIASSMRANRTMSVIIRTAGLDREREDIQRDYEYLVKLWNNIREETLNSTAPCLVYEESDLIKRAIRDSYTNDIEAIEVEGDESYKEAKDFVTMLMPGHEKKVKRYRGTSSIFTKHEVDEELEGLLSPQVKLPSGGYLIINPTEALISVDVNSGRSTTERNVEETAIKTNLEAAKEVARQMRLRDLAGLVVIDFIDMNYGKHRKQVERCMRDACKPDRAKIQLGRISNFGLMELSRQRIRPSLTDALKITCPHCKGAGAIYSPETIAFQVIRTLEKEAATEDYKELRIHVPSGTALKLLNEKRHLLHDIETRLKLVITVVIDDSVAAASFKLAKITLRGKEITHDPSSMKKPKRSEKTKRTRRTKSDQQADGDNDVDSSDSNASAASDNTASGTSDGEAIEEKPKRRTRGGRRTPKTDDTGEEKPKRRSRGGRRNSRNSKPSDSTAASKDDNDDGGDSPSRAASETVSAYADEKPVKTEKVVALSQTATNISQPQDTIDDPNSPKRKGWWSRVLEK